MNNRLSFCGLVDPSSSDKDLPVYKISLKLEKGQNINALDIASKGTNLFCAFALYFFRSLEA